MRSRRVAVAVAVLAALAVVLATVAVVRPSSPEPPPTPPSTTVRPVPPPAAPELPPTTTPPPVPVAGTLAEACAATDFSGADAVLSAVYDAVVSASAGFDDPTDAAVAVFNSYAGVYTQLAAVAEVLVRDGVAAAPAAELFAARAAEATATAARLADGSLLVDDVVGGPADFLPGGVSRALAANPAVAAALDAVPECTAMVASLGRL